MHKAISSRWRLAGSVASKYVKHYYICGREERAREKEGIRSSVCLQTGAPSYLGAIPILFCIVLLLFKFGFLCSTVDRSDDVIPFSSSYVSYRIS